MEKIVKLYETKKPTLKSMEMINKTCWIIIKKRVNCSRFFLFSDLTTKLRWHNFIARKGTFKNLFKSAF